MDGFFHLLNVGPQVVDAVAVVDGAVRLHGVHGTQAVFHHKERLLVAVVQAVHGDAQAHRVDGPAPLAGLEVGVRAAPVTALPSASPSRVLSTVMQRLE